MNLGYSRLPKEPAEYGDDLTTNSTSRPTLVPIFLWLALLINFPVISSMGISMADMFWCFLVSVGFSAKNEICSTDFAITMVKILNGA